MALNPKATRTEAIKAVLTILLGVVLLGVFVILLGGHRFWEDLVHYPVRFSTVKDLTEGRPVKYAGLTVGRVTHIAVDPDEPTVIRVMLGIERDFTLYSGVAAKVSQKGLVGDNYVLLEMLDEPGPALSPGDAIPARRTITMADLSQQMGEALGQLTPRLERVAKGLESMFTEENQQHIRTLLSELPAAVHEARAVLRTAGNNFGSLASTGEATMVEVREQTRTVSTQLQAALARVDSLASTLENDLPPVLTKAGDAFTSANNLAITMDQNMDISGRKMDRVLTNLNQLVREVQQLTRSLRERPWQVIYRAEPTEVP